MTKTKEGSTKRGTTTQYFRDFFTSHPEQLQERGNSKILDQYRKDHDLDEEDDVPKNVISSLNNLKTALKKGTAQPAKKVKSTASSVASHNGNGHVDNIPTAIKSYIASIRNAADSLEKMFVS